GDERSGGGLRRVGGGNNLLDESANRLGQLLFLLGGFGLGLRGLHGGFRLVLVALLLVLVALCLGGRRRPEVLDGLARVGELCLGTGQRATGCEVIGGRFPVDRIKLLE